MELELKEYIIKNHKQKYLNSCVPMSIELVLKLMNTVQLSYYDLQKELKDTPRSFKDFNGKVVNGVRMTLQYDINRDSNFPLEQLFNTIQQELEQGRFVNCAWKNEKMQSYHAYVIYGYNEDEFLAITTDFHNREFEYITDMKTRLINSKGSDILTFKSEI